MNKRVIKTAIIICWCLLIACVLFKMLGSKVFEIATLNPRFIEVCKWLDGDGIVAKYAIGFVMAYTSSLFLILASSMKSRYTLKQFIIVSVCIVGVWLLKVFYGLAGIIVECVMLCIIPAVISQRWWFGIAGLALNFLFQVCSMFIRGQEIAIFADNTIISLILSIDYYIMIALFYMYAVLINKKKEV